MDRDSMPITKVLKELETEFAPGVFKWIDETKDNAFTKAVNEAQNELVLKRYTSVQIMQDYKSKLLPFLKEYKKLKKIDEADNFLRNMRT